MLEGRHAMLPGAPRAAELATNAASGATSLLGAPVICPRPADAKSAANSMAELVAVNVGFISTAVAVEEGGTPMKTGVMRLRLLAVRCRAGAAAEAVTDGALATGLGGGGGINRDDSSSSAPPAAILFAVASGCTASPPAGWRHAVNVT